MINALKKEINLNLILVKIIKMYIIVKIINYFIVLTFKNKNFSIKYNI